MIKEEIIDNLTQQRLQALVAVHLHRKYISILRRRNLLVEFLTIAVPTFYIVPRFILKGTASAPVIEVAWELLASILLILAILRVVFKWQDREVRHTFMSYKNAEVAQEASQFLSKAFISSETVEQFLKRIADYDAHDNDDLLLGTPAKEDQEAFRKALKELVPGSTKLCPKCGADPWIYQKGSCEACGGTPKHDRNPC